MPDTLPEWIAESKQRIPEQLAERFDRGHWLAAYRIADGVSGKVVHDVREAMNKVHSALNPRSTFLIEYTVKSTKHRPREIGLPPAVEFDVFCPKLCFFWRASPDGEFFIISTFHKDEEQNTRTNLLPLLDPVWKTHECLALAAALTPELNPTAPLVQLRMEWHGLTNRQLLRGVDTCSAATHKDEAANEIDLPIGNVQAGKADYVQQLTADLYKKFGKTYDSAQVAAWLNENPNLRH